MEKSCFGCAVLEHSEWQALKKDEIAQLDQNKTCSHFERGGVIFNEGDPYTGVYCICEGLVGIRKLDGNGNTILLGRIGYAGTKLGYRPFLAGENHRATTETLEPSTLCFIKDA
ncbi:MAG: cyclic nucleotide-binding domain-containing protein, partial [Rhodospirillales bacterium]|nr:cyclic nucleotide-binding domain-containing protein [Rhodospirillales bacterium]